jgi:cobalt-zinc-cadmium efflux system protein
MENVLIPSRGREHILNEKSLMNKLNCHSHEGKTRRARSHLGLSLGLMLAVLIIEVAGGIWTRSLALLSDAGHVFLDAFALALALLAMRLADRPTSDARTFGYHRLEVFSAFINGLIVFAVSGTILWNGVLRLQSPLEIRVREMLAIALVGFVANVFVVWKLHPHSHGDINVRGAFLHALGDAGASVAVLVGGTVVYVTGWQSADAIAAMVVAVILSIHAARLLSESIHILLEGVPRGLNAQDVIQSIHEVPGVLAVEDLHVWNICSHICALSAHVVLAPDHMPDQKRVLSDISQVLSLQFNIMHTTIQVESSQWT